MLPLAILGLKKTILVFLRVSILIRFYNISHFISVLNASSSQYDGLNQSFDKHTFTFLAILYKNINLTNAFYLICQLNNLYCKVLFS